MSEELGRHHAAAGVPLEPPTPASAPRAPPTPAADLETPAQPPPSTKRSRLIAGNPGGGSSLRTADAPGDPYATLWIVSADGLIGKQPFGPASTLPKPVDEGLNVVVRLLASDAASRSVVIVAGGPVLTQKLMQEIVLRVPGGLDSFGPGRRVEALLKERSAEWGNVFESALLVKTLAKRQCAATRFGKVVVVVAACLADLTRRVYKYVFSDWRMLVDGGAGRGGRDLPLDIEVRAVELAGMDDVEEAPLLERATHCDDAWYRRGLEIYAQHPACPVRVGQQPKRGGSEDECAEPASKRRSNEPAAAPAVASEN